MVKNFLYYESSESSPDNPTSVLGRLTGSIFMGPAQDFEHRPDYIKERIKRVLTSDKIVSESVCPPRFARVNESFSTILEDEDHIVTKSTWIVPAPDLSSSVCYAMPARHSPLRGKALWMADIGQKPLALPIDEKGGDGIKRSKSGTLFSRLGPRSRHVSSIPTESEQSLRDKAREFCTRLHSDLVAAQNLNLHQDFRPDDYLYVARANPLMRSKRNSVSSATRGVHRPISPVSYRDPVIILEPGSARNSSASHLARDILRQESVSSSSVRARSPLRRSFVESPQPYILSDTHDFSFGRSGSGHTLGQGPAMVTPKTPAIGMELPFRPDYFVITTTRPEPESDSTGMKSVPASPTSPGKKRHKSLSWKMHKGDKLDSEGMNYPYLSRTSVYLTRVGECFNFGYALLWSGPPFD